MSRGQKRGAPGAVQSTTQAKGDFPRGKSLAQVPAMSGPSDQEVRHG